MKVKFITKWYGLETLSKEELVALRRPTEIAISKAALYFEGRVKKKLAAEPPRTGRIYIYKGREHQASAPGEPPAPMSGKLRQSITHTDVVWNGDEASAEVGSNRPYARRLEFGGVDSRGIRILPRPYFSATWIEEQDKIQGMLDKAVSAHPVLADVAVEVT